MPFVSARCRAPSSLYRLYRGRVEVRAAQEKSPGVAGAQSAEEATRSVHKRIVCEVLRQDIKLIAFMLFAILIMLGIVADQRMRRRPRRLQRSSSIWTKSGATAHHGATCMTGASPAAKRPSCIQRYKRYQIAPRRHPPNTEGSHGGTAADAVSCTFKRLQFYADATEHRPCTLFPITPSPSKASLHL